MTHSQHTPDTLKPLGSVEILANHLVREVSGGNFTLGDYHASRDTAREIDDTIERLKGEKGEMERDNEELKEALEKLYRSHPQVPTPKYKWPLGTQTTDALIHAHNLLTRLEEK